MSRGFQAIGLIYFLIAHQAFAQLDSSSAILLKPTGSSANKQHLDSSRYRIRAPESKISDTEDLEEKPGTDIPSPVATKPPSNKSASSTTTTLQVPREPPTPAVSVPSPVVAPGVTTSLKLKPAEPQSAPVTEQVTKFILGGSHEELEEVRNQIHPQDPRSNLVELSIAPAYFYTASHSEYSFREYTSHGPGLGLGMNIWLTPLFGLQSRFFTSASSGVRSGSSSVINMDTQNFEAGVRFRKHFGYSRKAAHLNWGIDYHDAVNKIGKEATEIVGRKSSGLGLSLEAIVPTSATYAHTMQVDIRPRLKHSEMNTLAAAKSGKKDETNGLSLAIGGQWTLDRENQVFWKSQYAVERSLFKGDANTPDPKTGITPDGVSVTNSLLIFYFGFRWGS